jgi:hypothetical protein
VFILKEVKVVCFDTLLQVLILKGVTLHQNCGKFGVPQEVLILKTVKVVCFEPVLQVLILKGLASGRMSKGVCSRSIPEPKDKEELSAETLRAQRFGGEGGPSTLRVNGVGQEEKRWQATALHRRGWIVEFTGHGSTIVNACQE